MHCWQYKPTWFMLRRMQAVINWRRIKSPLVYICMSSSLLWLSHLFYNHLSLYLFHFLLSTRSLSFSAHILCSNFHLNPPPHALKFIAFYFFNTTLFHVKEVAFCLKMCFVTIFRKLYWITLIHPNLSFIFCCHNIVLFNGTITVG